MLGEDVELWVFRLFRLRGEKEVFKRGVIKEVFERGGVSRNG